MRQIKHFWRNILCNASVSRRWFDLFTNAVNREGDFILIHSVLFFLPLCFTVIDAAVSSQMKLFILLADMVLYTVYSVQCTQLTAHNVQCSVSAVDLNCVTYSNSLHDFIYFAVYNEIRVIETLDAIYGFTNI